MRNLDYVVAGLSVQLEPYGILNSLIFYTGMYLLKQVVDLAIKCDEQGFFFEPRQAAVGVHLGLYVQMRLEAEA